MWSNSLEENNSSSISSTFKDLVKATQCHCAKDNDHDHAQKHHHHLPGISVNDSFYSSL